MKFAYKMIPYSEQDFQKERLESIKKVNEEVRVLNGIMREMHYHVSTQGDHLDSIEVHMDRAAQNSERALEEVERGNVIHQRRTQRCKRFWSRLLCCCVYSD